jgi:hypothetical protein
MAGVLSVAAGAGCEAQQAAQVSHQQFQQLEWLIGTWQGSGGAYPAFFEEYRRINDSTIQMRAFADSTLRVATDSSTIEWRNGAVRSRGASSADPATEVTPTKIRFVRRSGGGGYTFTQVSPDEWHATLDPPTAGGQPTVYVMRRIKR